MNAPQSPKKAKRKPPNVVSLAEHDFRWTGNLLLASRGIRSTHGNVGLMLRHHHGLAGKLAFDVRHGVARWLSAPPWATDKETFPRPMVDADATYAAQWAEAQRLPVVIDGEAKESRLVGSPSTWLEAILAEAYRHQFDPVAVYLESLRGAWDGIGRVSRLAPYFFGAGETLYEKQVLQNFVIAAVARALRPGCKVDSMPILEGKQGIGKSTALRVLFGDAFFADSLPDLATKDAMVHLQGPWGIEIGELAGLPKKDSEAIKRFLSSVSDRFRQPHGRLAQDHPRRVVFAGSTNASEYLKDPTGNRRFWPVHVGVDGPIRLEELAEQRDQIWAEAVELFDEGTTWWEIDQRAHALETEARMVHDLWADDLRAYAEGREYVELAAALEKAVGLPKERHDLKAKNRAVAILTSMGWERRQIRTLDEHGNKTRKWVYTRPALEEAAE